MWTEWLLAVAVLIGATALLPRLLRSARPSSRKLSGSGVVLGFGLVFAMIFDPKAVQATEEVQKLKDTQEQDESGEKSL